MLRRLQIQHFRGIQNAEWPIDHRLTCLVGSGDSTKTTLLDAIGMVLSPSYTVQFSDTDFFALDLSKNITIEAVVTELPDSLIKESQLGKDRSGLMPDGTLVHDPVDGAEECLIVRLTVTCDLDPLWEIVRPDSDDARPISAAQRRRLGFFRLGERPDFHLRWARGSALSGLTGGGEDASALAVDAQRKAREAVFANQASQLQDASREVQIAAGDFGAAAFEHLRPGLEPGSANSGYSLMLHDEKVPLSNFGLGTRRLTSLSIQDRAMSSGSIIAIDEIEHGLEPHRLTQALYQLKKRTDAEQLQVITTTHSPVAVKTLSAVDFVVVRSDGMGTTTCRQAPDDINNTQGTFRSAPEALLGRRIIVGEGATEVGFLKGLTRHWDKEQRSSGSPIAAVLGTVLVNGGGGAQAVGRAEAFHELGYPTCLLIDNDDRAIDRHVEGAQRARVSVQRWEIGNSLEDEVIKTLGADGLQAIVDLAIDIKGPEAIRASVGNQLGSVLEGTSVADWQAQISGDQRTIQKAIAAASQAKDKSWFKREDHGEDLANVVISNWDGLSDTHMMKVIERLRSFAYDRAPEPPAVEHEKKLFHE